MIWQVIWIVLMILWLFGGGFVCYEGEKFNGRYFAGYTLVPWICVLLLGLALSGAISFNTPAPAAARETRPYR